MTSGDHVVDRIEAGGVRIAYDVHGTGDPVLLIPALGMQRQAWLVSVGPLLVDAGLQVVTFDMRGIGDSDAPPAPYTVAQIAADTAALIESLGLAPCRIAGYSLGGFVAQELARWRPELVRSAALLASAGPMTAYGRLTIEAGHESAMTEADVPRRRRIKETLAELLTPAQLQDDGLVAGWIELLTTLPEWENPGRQGQYAAALGWIQEEGAAERWAAIPVPLLVVAFEHDVAFRPVGGRGSAQAADAELVVIGDAAHGGPFTHAGVLAQHLVEFFRRT